MKKPHPLIGELSGELLGTAILVMFGCGVVAQVITGGFPKSLASGDHNSIAFGWGLGVTMAVFVAGRISGGRRVPGTAPPGTAPPGTARPGTGVAGVAGVGGVATTPIVTRPRGERMRAGPWLCPWLRP
jgi:hypothetical protein